MSSSNVSVPVVIGSRSPVEGYDFMTKIEEMDRQLQKKRGGTRRKTIKNAEIKKEIYVTP